MASSLNAAAVGLVASLALWLPGARADIIDCDSSDLPECIRVCPGGDFPVEATLIGISGAPLANTPVRLIIDSSCTELLPCPGDPYPVYEGVTDTGGHVVFDIALSGCCTSPAAVVLEVDPGGVACAVYDSITSTDTSIPLDGFVGLADFVLFQTHFLSDDPCHDYYGCDGFVALPDFVVFQTHFLHECP